MEPGGEELEELEIFVDDPMYIIIPLTVIYSIIFLMGVIGNVTTCIVISKNKHMQTATNFYLFSLAVSDLLLLCSGLPQEMVYLLHRSYIFGEAFCVLTGFVAETCANATVLTITAFTVERYIAICHPFFAHTVSKLSRAVKFIIAIWLLALCLAVPQAIQFGILYDYSFNNETHSEGAAYCTTKMDDTFLGRHAFEISTGVFFVTPMTIITVLYLIIGFKLRRTQLVKRPSLCSQSPDNVRGQKRVVRMLVAVVVAFFICWAPFHAQRLWAVYANSFEIKSVTMFYVHKALTYTSGILYYMSTCINPVLYSIMSYKFREAFKVTLARLCGKKPKGPLRTYSVLSRNNTRRASLLMANANFANELPPMRRDRVVRYSPPARKDSCITECILEDLNETPAEPPKSDQDQVT